MFMDLSSYQTSAGGLPRYHDTSLQQATEHAIYGIRPGPLPDASVAGQRQQGVQQRVRAALDGRRVARLVDPVALAALRRNEDHPGVPDAGQVLRVVAGRRVEAARGEAELGARRLDRRLHPC